MRRFLLIFSCALVGSLAGAWYNSAYAGQCTYGEYKVKEGERHLIPDSERGMDCEECKAQSYLVAGQDLGEGYWKEVVCHTKPKTISLDEIIKKLGYRANGGTFP